MSKRTPKMEWQSFFLVNQILKNLKQTSQMILYYFNAFNHGITENKDSGLWGTLEDPGPLRTLEKYWPVILVLLWNWWKYMSYIYMHIYIYIYIYTYTYIYKDKYNIINNTYLNITIYIYWTKNDWERKRDIRLVCWSD